MRKTYFLLSSIHDVVASDKISYPAIFVYFNGTAHYFKYKEDAEEVTRDSKYRPRPGYVLSDLPNPDNIDAF